MRRPRGAVRSAGGADWVVHAPGVSHVFVDIAVDLDRAEELVLDSMVDPLHRADTQLLHRDLAGAGAERMFDAMRASGVALFAAPDAPWDILPVAPHLDRPHTERACTIQLVDDVAGAVAHVQRYGGADTDIVITLDEDAIEAFLRGVRSPRVFVNASTRRAAALELGRIAVEELLTTRVELI